MTGRKRRHSELQPCRRADTLQPEHWGHHHHHGREDPHHGALGHVVRVLPRASGRPLWCRHNRRKHKPPITRREARGLHWVLQQDDALNDQADRNAPDHYQQGEAGDQGRLLRPVVRRAGHEPR